MFSSSTVSSSVVIASLIILVSVQSFPVGPASGSSSPATTSGATIPILLISSDGPTKQILPGSGGLATLSIDIREGTGRVFANTNIHLGKTWLDSAKTAIHLAQALTRIDLSSKDITFTVVPSNSSDVIETLDGDSAGAAITVLLVSELEGKAINNNTVITGAIKPNGDVGMVAGVLEKATAAGKYGAKLMLVPAGQAYYPSNSCLSQGDSDSTAQTQILPQICLLEEKSLADVMDRRYDMRVIEIHNIQEALNYYQLTNLNNQTAATIARPHEQQREQQPEKMSAKTFGQEKAEDYKLGNNNNNGPIVNLSNNAGRSSFSKPNALLSNNGFIAAAGSNVYVVWVDNSTGTLGSHDILLARSSNNGLSFEKPIDLSFPLRNDDQTFGVSHSPQIVAFGKTVYVVWVEFTYASSSENLDSVVLYARSFDGGRSFQGPFNTMRDNGCLGIAEPKKACLPMLITDPRLVMDGNNNNSSNYVYATWTSRILVPPSPPTSSNSTTSQEKSENGRGASARDVFFTVIGPDGSTEPANISSDVGDSQFPRIASSGSNIYVAWTDNSYGSSEILFRRIAIGTDTSNSSVRTISEQSVVNVSDSPQEDDQPELAASASSVFIMWQHSQTDGDSQEKTAIYSALSHDNGTTFSSPTRFAATSISSKVGPSHSIAVVKNDDLTNEERVYAVWTDGIIGEEDVYFSMVNAAANSDTETSPSVYSNQLLTSDARAVPFAQFSLSGNAVYVAWTESTPNGTSIYYTAGNVSAIAREGQGVRSTISFSTPVNITNNSIKFAYNPQLASTKNHVYLVWEGRYSYNTMSDIYFKRLL